MSVNPQVIHQKNEAYTRKKFKRYLSQTLDDPLSDVDAFSKKLKKRRIREVASAIQHWGHLLTTNEKPKPAPSHQYPPELLDQIPHDPRYNWQSVKKYRMCVYGDRNIVQAGDVVVTHDDQKGEVEYFIQPKKNRPILMHMALVQSKSDLPPQWQVFVPSEEELITTDQDLTVPLGSITRVEPRDHVKFSPFVIRKNCLVERKAAPVDTTTIRTVLVKGYLTCSSAVLYFNPLVQLATRYMGLKCTEGEMTHLIKHDFYPYAVAMINDEQDEDDFEDTEFSATHRVPLLSGDSCNFCQEPRKMVYSSEKHKACEPCYVRLRTLYRMFQLLEPARQQFQTLKYLDHSKARMTEIYSFVSRIVEACPYSVDRMGR